MQTSILIPKFIVIIYGKAGLYVSVWLRLLYLYNNITSLYVCVFIISIQSTFPRYSTLNILNHLPVSYIPRWHESHNKSDVDLKSASPLKGIRNVNSTYVNNLMRLMSSLEMRQTKKIPKQKLEHHLIKYSFARESKNSSVFDNMIQSCWNGKGWINPSGYLADRVWHYFLCDRQRLDSWLEGFYFDWMEMEVGLEIEGGLVLCNHLLVYACSQFYIFFC